MLLTSHSIAAIIHAMTLSEAIRKFRDAGIHDVGTAALAGVAISTVRRARLKDTAHYTNAMKIINAAKKLRVSKPKKRRDE